MSQESLSGQPLLDQVSESVSVNDAKACVAAVGIEEGQLIKPGRDPYVNAWRGQSGGSSNHRGV
jgi:hypothetical protein